jgi:hypothetical protein
MLRKPFTKGRVISISLVLLALAAVTLALRPRAAQAEEKEPFMGTQTVQAEVIATIGGCGIGDTQCIECIGQHPGAVFVEAQGFGGSSLGTLFSKVLKCATQDPPFGSYFGTLTTTAPNGKDSITWDYTGKNDTAGDAYQFQPFSGLLTVKGGTGKFAGAQGSATFTANSGPGTPGPTPNSFVAMAFYSLEGQLGFPDGN